MKKATLLITCLLLFFTFSLTKGENLSAFPQDSTSTGMTKDDIALIMKIFDGQNVKSVKEKADQLIISGKDSSDCAFIAATIFDYYYSSKIMGYEEVALYIADRYFLSKKYEWPNEEGYTLLKMFAEFNRNSMIGMPAPELALPDSLGNIISVRKSPGKYKLLFFYDEDCKICQAYTAKLMKYLSTYESGNISVFRIYTQSDRERWIKWVRRLNTTFKVSDKVKLFDIWDPDFSSDFQKKYGVITTPQVVLINEDNIIFGRKLDPKAVATLIDMDYNKPTELDLFIEKLFASILPYDTSTEIDTTLIMSTIDDLYKKSSSDTTLFQEVMYSTYQYLKNNSEYNLQRGAAYLGTQYITKMPLMWLSANFTDSLNSKGKAPLGAIYSSPDSFLSETAKAVELFHRNQLGKPVANLFLTTVSKKPYSIYDSKTKYTILYFYNMDCALCEAVSADMKKIYEEFKSEDIEFIGIYTGKEKKKWPKYVASNQFEWINVWDKSGKSDMFAKYDLSGVPVIYMLNEKKETIAKDITPSVLKEILGYLFNNK